MISFFEQHIYLLLFLLSLVEGPIVSFLSSGFAAQGILRIDLVIVLMLAGDLLGDLMLYGAGFLFRKTGVLGRFGRFSKQIQIAYKGIRKHPFKYFLLVKITPYLAVPSLLFIGHKKYSFLGFLLYSFSTTLLVKSVYLLAGYYGSVSVQQISWFLAGRKQVVIYTISGVILFLLVRKLYFYLARFLRKSNG